MTDSKPSGAPSSTVEVTKGEPPGAFAGTNDPNVGRTVGRYLVLERLGAGGMGVVYAAWDQTLDRKVALKLIHPERLGSSKKRKRAIQRMIKEARSLARLDHPNVVRVHEVGADAEQVFISMEFVEGLTLRNWRTAALRGWKEITEVFASAGRGLAAAHGVGLVHGDFKPDNVIVGPRGEVKVLDFGLARGLEDRGGGDTASGEDLSSDLNSVSERLLASASGNIEANPDAAAPVLVEQTSVADRPAATVATASQTVGLRGDATRGATTIAGTPAYMSPEHFLGKRTSEATDQFAFCVALYEALYGHRPFGGESTAEIAINVIEGALKVPGKRGVARVPRFLQRAVTRGLSMSPDNRFPSMDVLVRELERRPGRVAALGVIAAAGVVLVLGLGMGLQERLRSGETCSDMVSRIDEVRAPAGIHELLKGERGEMTGRTRVMAEYFTVALDNFRSQWRSAARTSCDDLHVRGSISVDEYDMRQQCLEYSKEQLELFLEGLLSSAGLQLSEAAAKLQEIADPRFCLEAERDATGTFSRQQDPAYQAMRREVVEIKTLLLYGSYELASTRVRDLIPRLEAAGEEHLLCTAILNRAKIDDWNGNVSGALKGYRRAYLLAERTHDDFLRLKSTLLMVATLTNMHKYEEAELALDRAEALTKRLETRRLSTAQIPTDRGYLAFKRGDLKGAQKLLEPLLEQIQHDPSEWNRERDILTTLGLIYRDTGQLEAAEKAFRRVCDVIESNMGPYHPDNATCRVNLASSIAMRGRLKEADDLYNTVLEFHRLNADSDGSINESFVYTLKAIMFAEAGDFAKAAEYERRSMEILKSIGLGDSVDFALVMDNLGLTLAMLNDVEEAHQLLTDAEEMWARFTGPDHGDLSYPVGHLAYVNIIRGDLDAARSQYARARGLRDKMPQDAVDTSLLNFVGAVLTHEGDPAGARALSTEALALLEEQGRAAHLGALRAWHAAPRAPADGSSNFALVGPREGP